MRMKLPPRLRAAYERWATWARANRLNLLKDLPLWYLVVMAALPGLGAALVAPMVPEATRVYINHLLPLAPWPLSVALGLWLLAWWTLLGLFTLMAATHGRALGERLFNSPPTRT